MKLKNMFGVVAGAAIIATSMISAPVSAITCPEGTARAGDDVGTIAQCNVEKDDTLMESINNIISVIIGVLGLAAVIVVVLGGVMYVTSTGDPAKVKKAKDTILYGIIGLVVAILAYAIVNFVLSSFFSGKADSGSSGGGDDDNGSYSTIIYS